MSKGTDLSVLYSLRSTFTIIALTGRTGSGALTVAGQISSGFSPEIFKNKLPAKDTAHNSYRKYEILYRFGEENIKPFIRIFYRDIITLFILKYPFESLTNYLDNGEIKAAFKVLKEKEAEDLLNNTSEIRTKEKRPLDDDYSLILKQIESQKENFLTLQKQFQAIDLDKIREGDNAELLYDFFFNSKFPEFSAGFHDIFKKESSVKHHMFCKTVTDNIRRSGEPYHPRETDASNIFEIASTINTIIKAVRRVKENEDKDEPTKIVIDFIRNPFEIMFFKQRYAAFYLIAVNCKDIDREQFLKRDVYGNEWYSMKYLLEQEYIGGKGREFYKSYLRSCIEKADIHITYRKDEETAKLNSYRSDNTSPYYTWQMQLLKYLTLIEHPGLVTPSPEERCMQLAYTAKYNSGCISRQVGASITDENYSIKAIGWNNTPQGQVPCVLRNAESLLNVNAEELKKQIEWENKITVSKKLEPVAENSDEKNDYNQTEEEKSFKELLAFTPFEKTNEEFRDALEANFKQPIAENSEILKKRNVCMCFKSLYNSCVEGKNQVHTRSLHAEESAFLQITKYGGTAIINGKLFTTASPCELCAKKAYQLGIKVIYYVDPYPGISNEQILNTGSQKPEVRLFNGAIGSAYHWLYEPFMAYKDELAILLNQNIEDVTKKQKAEIKKLREENKILKEQIGRT